MTPPHAITRCRLLSRSNSSLSLARGFLRSVASIADRGRWAQAHWHCVAVLLVILASVFLPRCVGDLAQALNLES